MVALGEALDGLGGLVTRRQTGAGDVGARHNDYSFELQVVSMIQIPEGWDGNPGAVEEFFLEKAP